MKRKEGKGRKRKERGNGEANKYGADMPLGVPWQATGARISRPTFRPGWGANFQLHTFSMQFGGFEGGDGGDGNCPREVQTVARLSIHVD